MGRIERQTNAVNTFLEKVNTEGMGPSKTKEFQSLAVWAMVNFENYTDDVLIAACGDGLLACFIASMNSDKRIMAIDFDEKLIEKANGYKEALGLTNIEFRVSDFTDLERQFDTVLMFNTFPENVGADASKMRFKKFNVQIKMFTDEYGGYIDAVSDLTAPSGKVMAVEKVDPGTELFGILTAFNENGMTYIDKNTGSMEYVDPVSQSKVEFWAFELKKEPESADNLFVKWADKQLGDKMTPAKADYIIFTNAGKQLEGYLAYEGAQQVVESGIYENAEDPDSFYIYRASSKGKNVLRYPQTRMSEAKLTLTRDKEIDRKNGLNIIEFQPGGKATIDFGSGKVKK